MADNSQKILLGALAVGILVVLYKNYQDSPDSLTQPDVSTSSSNTMPVSASGAMPMSMSAASVPAPTAAAAAAVSSVIPVPATVGTVSPPIVSTKDVTLPYLSSDNQKYTVDPATMQPIVVPSQYTPADSKTEPTPFDPSQVINVDGSASNYVANNPLDTVDVQQSLLSSGQYLGGISTRISPRFVNYDIRHTPLPPRSDVSFFLQSSYPPADERKSTFTI